MKGTRIKMQEWLHGQLYDLFLYTIVVVVVVVAVFVVNRENRIT